VNAPNPADVFERLWREADFGKIGAKLTLGMWDTF